jgi:Serine/threonine protein phosphatase
MSETTARTTATTAAAPDAAGLTYAVAGKTDKGVQRSTNEDAYALLEIPGFDQAFVVADGMGGLQAGEVASGEAVRVIGESLKASPNAASAPLAALHEALTRANDAVFALTQGLRSDGSAEEEPTQRPGPSARPPQGAAIMGTTAVVGLVRGGTLYLCHAGDSRAYLFRAGELIPLTEDHSFVAERVRAGDMTEAEARVSRFRNMITRAVGIDAQIQPDVREEPLQAGDLVLVCTDGLTTMVEDEEIRQMLAAPALARSAPERVAASLVEAANRNGGADNITVVVLKVGGTGGGGSSSTASAGGRGTAAVMPTAGATQSGARRSSAPAQRNIIDMDARRRGTSPVLVTLASLGVIALGLAAILAGSEPLRRQAARVLIGRPVAPPPAPSGTRVEPLRDYEQLTYAPPAPFATREFLARGDLLAYSPGVGVFSVRDSSGVMVSLTRGGDMIRNVASLEVAPPSPDPAPASRVFVATDLQGNLYLSYTARKVIEKRSPEGKLLAKITAGLTRPEAVAVDEQGNIYVIDRNILKVLRAIDPSPEAGGAPAGADSSPAPQPSPKAS